MNKPNAQDSSLARQDANIAAWSPVSQFTELRRMMDDLFSRAFGYTPLSTLIPGQFGHQPDVDIYETDDKVVMLCPLPGFEPGQIDVQASEDTISVKGERKSLFEHPKAMPYRQGSSSSAAQFQATYSLPNEIDPNKISATFRNGVLQIDAPKSERAKHKSVKVNVKSQG